MVKSRDFIHSEMFLVVSGEDGVISDFGNYSKMENSLIQHDFILFLKYLYIFLEKVKLI